MHAESWQRRKKDERHSSLEKYSSHFIWKGSKGLVKVLLWEGWVGDRTELQHIDPHSYGHNSVSFPFSWAAQPGAWRSSLSGCWFSLSHLISSPLNFLWTKLYNCSTSTFFLWESQIALIQPVHDEGYILIFLDWMHLLFTQVHFLFWELGRGQYVTTGCMSKKQDWRRKLACPQNSVDTLLQRTKYYMKKAPRKISYNNQCQ